MKPSGRVALLAYGLGVLLFAGSTRAAESTRQLRDDTGEAIALSPAPCRIVSLAPGTTAMLFAAGAGHCMVGTIAHSKEPAEAAKVPVVGDAETLDFEQLIGLRPTVVVVAVDVVQRVRIDRIRALGIPVYQVHVTRLAQMPESLRRLGALAGTEATANREADALAADLAAIDARYRSRAPIRVLYQIWDRPIYTIGGRHVITDALTTCGAVNVFADLETAAPAVTREAVVLRNPGADPRFGATRGGRRLAGRVAEISGDGRRARPAAREICRRAHRSHGPFGHRGNRQPLCRHRQGALNPPSGCTRLRGDGILRSRFDRNLLPWRAVTGKAASVRGRETSMKAIFLIAGIAIAASGCATTATQTAWGKPGVSRTDYGTDVGMCTGFASQEGGGGPANTAGGINGRNNTSAGGGTGAEQASASVPAMGTYSGMASPDFAQRAATQQRTQQMAEQRARADALKACLVERGYLEFALTPEQAAHVATLQKGSNEYLEYMYKLGSDAEIVGKQSRAPAK